MREPLKYGLKAKTDHPSFSFQVKHMFQPKALYPNAAGNLPKWQKISWTAILGHTALGENILLS